LALPLLWQTFVESERWSALDLWQKLSTNPLAILKQPASPITEGQTAELTLFDPHTAWEVKPSTLKSLSSNTPYLDTTILGRVVKTWYSR
jgi:dihydroorotase